MKRRKVDATPVNSTAAAPQSYERSMHHHQHLYSNSPPMSSYAQLQQQLHLQQQQQQQRLAASSRYASERRNSPYPVTDERAMHMRAQQQQQQRASQGHLRTTNGVALQRTNGGASTAPYLAAATVGSRVQQDRYPSATGTTNNNNNKRQYEQYQQQQRSQNQTPYQNQQLRSYPHPSAMMPRTTGGASTSSPNSSPFSIASSISTSCSPVVTMATSGSSTTTTTTSRAMGTESPLSLPGISSMLRMPNSNLTAGDTTADGSLSVHSPMLMQQTAGSSSNMFSLPYKWTPEMASISPVKVNDGVAPPALSLSSSSQQDTSSSRTTASGYYNCSRPASKPITAVAVIPEPAAAVDRSRSTRHRQSFDSNDGKSLSATSSSSNTPRSQICSNGGEQVQNRNGLTSSSTTGSGSGTTIADSTSTPEERIANPNKNSRYLREMDRREILARIEQGEKQATLAKEYQVSRAAICNLNKHREDVMQRKDENPLAKHPKKPRPKLLKVKVRSSSKAANRKLPSPRLNGTGGSGKGSNTHEVKSRAAALLLTNLRNKNTTMSEFRRSSERLVRLVLEEALALVPIKAVEVFLSDSVRADGVGWEHPPCAISMENASQQHSMEAGSPLLELFRAIEPDQPTARANIIEELGDHHSEDENMTQFKTQQVNLEDTHLLPASLKYHNVFVFDVSATSPDAICAVVQKLQERGAVEAMICLVVLFIDSEVIASVHKKYPSVKIVAAQIDPSGKTPAPSAARAPGADSAICGVNATANGEKLSATVAPRPPCCLEFVLSRFRQLYDGSFTTTTKGLGSHLIK